MGHLGHLCSRAPDPCAAGYRGQSDPAEPKGQQGLGSCPSRMCDFTLQAHARVQWELPWAQVSGSAEQPLCTDRTLVLQVAPPSGRGWYGQGGVRTFGSSARQAWRGCGSPVPSTPRSVT